jgi:hypothetical protein
MKFCRKSYKTITNNGCHLFNAINKHAERNSAMKGMQAILNSLSMTRKEQRNGMKFFG